MDFETTVVRKIGMPSREVSGEFVCVGLGTCARANVASPAANPKLLKCLCNFINRLLLSDVRVDIGMPSAMLTGRQKQST